MTVRDITTVLESVAPLNLQESYDNSGLITGDGDWECGKLLISLDATEEVIKEAVANGCNMVVSHHPILFSPIRKINGTNYVEKAIIAAIKNNVALYACHTNLDNVLNGVNSQIASRIGLQEHRILSPKQGMLKKLAVFVPRDKSEAVRQQMFNAGAGHIGKYSECSFTVDGTGTFKAGPEAKPFMGNIGEREDAAETRLEVIVPDWLLTKVIAAMKAAHPYEEVAYDVFSLSNVSASTGSGLIGKLETAVSGEEFLQQLKELFNIPVIRYTAFDARPIRTVAVCGGAGSFLTRVAMSAGADAFVTADIRYHEFFDAEQKMLLADIGHYESEQFTVDLLHDILKEKFPNFAVLKTAVNTNPVRYF